MLALSAPLMIALRARLGPAKPKPVFPGLPTTIALRLDYVGGAGVAWRAWEFEAVGAHSSTSPRAGTSST